ncbi:hypothetical protein PE36_00065 [Moritella sp. PE36]|uniref:hypothetical protein n=1 Tax=Moritella sp. PE36 TaxID=58051 RepID=UPI0001569149|nr:hypothetical protein [Moritella sp. PE36]EDM66144.1 hypothetical protein PE36_00065 [Moritella sp. PE36]
MALTLIHPQFKTLIDNLTNLDSYPVYIPETAKYPAICYSMESVARDVDSNQNGTTISAHVFNVYLVAHEFSEAQLLTQNLISTLDQYSDSSFLLTLVEDVADEYDPDKDVFIKILTVTVRLRE